MQKDRQLIEQLLEKFKTYRGASAATGISTKTISDVMNHGKSLYNASRKRIADALNIDFEVRHSARAPFYLKPSNTKVVKANTVQDAWHIVITQIIPVEELYSKRLIQYKLYKKLTEDLYGSSYYVFKLAKLLKKLGYDLLLPYSELVCKENDYKVFQKEGQKIWKEYIVDSIFV